MTKDEELEKIKKEAGFLKNKDGSLSDKYIIIFILVIACFIIPAIISFHWSFKEQPLPEYALQLLSLIIKNGAYIIGAFAGFQSFENSNFIKNVLKGEDDTRKRKTNK